MSVVDFRSKLNFEPKQVQFIDKVYTLKTDHKTGLLLQELYKKKDETGVEDKILQLTLGEKQYKELMAELDNAGKETGSVNYDENMKVILFAIMSVLYNQPYETFEQAVNDAPKK